MRRLAVAAALAALVGASAAGAAAPWRTVHDASDGFTISVPPGWQVVPRSDAALAALVSRLRREKRVGLANQFLEVQAARKVSRAVFRFEAFPWPAPSGPVVPDVTVKTDPVDRQARPSDLPALAKQIAKALARTPGTRVGTPVSVRLPAGPSIRLDGSVRLGKTTRRSGFTFFLWIHGRRLYTLSFRGPTTLSPYLARVERGIVERFRLT